jgi:hypothetical protein
VRKGEQLLSLSHSEPFVSPDSGSLFYVRNIRRTVMLWKFRAKKSGTFSGRGRPAVRGGEMKRYASIVLLLMILTLSPILC